MAGAIPKTNTYYAEDRAAWRKWLSENHDSCPGIWLVYYKKGSGKTRVNYDEAVEEALCFGWIDSTLNPIDELCYMQLYTPRKPKSGWSKLNKDRVERLIANGLMTPAGIAKIEIAQKNGMWAKLDHVEAFTIPAELSLAFENNPQALAYYNTLASSNKKMILYHINNTNKQETRINRINDIVSAANNNKMLDRFTSSATLAKRKKQ